MEYSTRGTHILCDTWGVDFNILNNFDWLREKMKESIEVSGATILSVQGEKFDPQGVTLLFLLSESHMSIHTYPEKHFASIDIYTCGESVNPQTAIEYFLEELNPEVAFIKRLARGIGELKEE